MKDNLGRKLYSIGEFYKIYYLLFFSMRDFIRAKRKKLLSEQFIERIMIAVTEVNGCPFCSYAHTKMALEAGMSNEEIQNMLAGISDDVPEEEMSAVVFAQHYAETRGKPSNKAWLRIVEIYGVKKAKGILGAIRIMMFGNVAGIAWGSFVSRFKKVKKTDKRSNLLYEIGIVLGTFIFIPLSLLHALLAKLFRVSTTNFKDVDNEE